MAIDPSTFDALKDAAGSEDNTAVRELLHTEWRSIEERIVAAGLPQGPTVQTMVTIAAEEFARVYGPGLAAEYFGAISSAFRQHAADPEWPTNPRKGKGEPLAAGGSLMALAAVLVFGWLFSRGQRRRVLQ